MEELVASTRFVGNIMAWMRKKHCDVEVSPQARQASAHIGDMPRHLFDEYTNGCSEKEKKKIVEEIRMAIGRDPKYF